MHGGCTEEATHEHFATRFLVSAGRVLYPMVAPKNSFATISDAILSGFSDGHVALLDIPCGTGAMSCSVISMLTHLRAVGISPRLPLTITINGGDFSESALEIYNALMQKLKPLAAAQGIAITWRTQLWDAMRSDQTACLMDNWLEASLSAKELFVVVSNFSGALHKVEAFNTFSPCLEQILSRLCDRRHTVIWVEPNTNQASKHLLNHFTSFLEKRIPWLPGTSPENFLNATFNIEHSISKEPFRSNLFIQYFNEK